MLKSNLIGYICCASSLILNMNAVSAQDFPAKPIRLVAQNPGGSGDFAARLILPAISKGLGQQVFVDNRTTIVAMETVARAAADGYTILIAGTSFWVSPLMTKDLPYDPLRDFVPISLVARTPTVIVVHPSLPVKSVKELIALAKARPGELNFSTGGPGTEIDGLLFNSMANVKIQHVPYRGNGAAVTALIGGEVQLMYANASFSTQYIKSGKLRAIAVATLEPSALVPGLPTVASTVPGFELVGASSIFAPAKTGGAIINRLHQEIARAVNLPDIREKFLNTGAEPVGSTPEQLDVTMKSQMSKLGKIIKEAGLRTE